MGSDEERELLDFEVEGTKLPPILNDNAAKRAQAANAKNTPSPPPSSQSKEPFKAVAVNNQRNYGARQLQ